MPAKLELVLANDISEVARVLELIEAFTEDNNIGRNGAFKLNLVLDELVTNILTHGCRGNPGCRIALAVEYDGTVIQVDLVDNGVPFNPVEAVIPEIGETLEDSHVGGLGVRLVRKYASRMDYRRDGENNNFHFEMNAS